MVWSLFLYFIYQSKNFTFHVHFHGCLFIHLCYEWTVSLYVFASIHQAAFSSMGRLRSVLVPNCAAVSYFENSRVSFASKFHPFQFPCVFFYGSSSVHLIERASVGILLLFQKHFFHSSHKPPFKSMDNVFLSMVVLLFSGECRDSLFVPALKPPLSFWSSSEGTCSPPNSIVSL